MMKRRQRDKLADTPSALFPENVCFGMKTIVCVFWLWMSQAALLCLLYLVLLKAATIHHYLVADAPNHSIPPLIYFNTSLHYRKTSSIQACNVFIHLSICVSRCPSTHVNICQVFHSSSPSLFVHVIRCIFIHLYPPKHPLEFVCWWGVAFFTRLSIYIDQCRWNLAILGLENQTYKKIKTKQNKHNQTKIIIRKQIMAVNKMCMISNSGSL